MKKSRPKPARTSHKSIALLLSILLVAVILGSFSLMQVNNNPQQVEGITNTNTRGLGYVFQPTGRPPVIPYGLDPQLTCDQCARFIAMRQNGTGSSSSLCLNTTNSTGAYAHCATGSITGETCVTCPTVTPFPTKTPVPTGCHYIHNSCPYIYCRPSSLNGTPNACPTCIPWRYVCDGNRQPAAPLGQNTPVNVTRQRYNFFQNFLHAFIGGNSNSSAKGN